MIDNKDESLMYKLDINDVEDFSEIERFFRLNEEECDEPKELDFYNKRVITDDFYPEIIDEDNG
jgi:hypothetical protein